MKIIILGAGQVGITLAESLAGEEHHITLVDDNAEHLEKLQAKHDLRVLEGSASSPSVLRQAGADEAELLVAVTPSDEVNMIACQVGYSLFNIPTKVARVRNSEYLREEDKLFQNSMIPVDHLISPERLVVEEISRLIHYPGALQIYYLAEEKVSVVVVRAYYGGPLVGSPLSALKDYLPHIDSRIVAIKRGERMIRPQGSTIVEAGDEITYICDTDHVKAIMSQFQRLERPYKRIMIIGGGSIALGVAKKLEHHCHIKLIERNEKKAVNLAEELSATLVLHGDPSDENLLFEENIEAVDMFLSLTSDDETNIMSGLLAKRLGAKNTMVLIQRLAYVNLLNGGSIDIALSPQQTTVSAMLNFVRRGDVVGTVSMRQGQAEVQEIVVHGNEQSSQVIGRKVEDIKLPAGCVIAAIVRQNQVVIAKRQVVIEEGDHVVIYINDKKAVLEVEKLFQPSVAFI